MFKAAIFDMDGVLVDNHHYHQLAWEKFCKEKEIPFSTSEFRERYFGKNNHDILSALLNRDVSPDEVYELGEAKEALYREIYRPHIKPVYGLIEFLKYLQDKGIKLAVATSANKPNLNFVIENLSIGKFFSALVDASQVSHSKPNPEIFLRAANKLGVRPEYCIVFEDSVLGINAAKTAKMSVIALLTTHTQNQLPATNLYIQNFKNNLLIPYLNLA